MKRDGYEADKNDIIVDFKGMKMNLTANWDGTVEHFKWSPDGKGFLHRRSRRNQTTF
jgi:hypothetical protein